MNHPTPLGSSLSDGWQEPPVLSILGQTGFPIGPTKQWIVTRVRSLPRRDNRLAIGQVDRQFERGQSVLHADDPARAGRFGVDRPDGDESCLERPNFLLRR